MSAFSVKPALTTFDEILTKNVLWVDCKHEKFWNSFQIDPYFGLIKTQQFVLNVFKERLQRFSEIAIVKRTLKFK